jgi:hypothetical protein
MRAIHETSQFRRDVKKLKKQGKDFEKCKRHAGCLIVGAGDCVRVVGACFDICSISNYAALGRDWRALAQAAGVNSGIILLVAAGNRVRTSRR